MFERPCLVPHHAADTQATKSLATSSSSVSSSIGILGRIGLLGTITTIVCTQLAELPLASVAVQVIMVTPIG